MTSKVRRTSQITIIVITARQAASVIIENNEGPRPQRQDHKDDYIQLNDEQNDDIVEKCETNNKTQKVESE